MSYNDHSVLLTLVLTDKAVVHCGYLLCHFHDTSYKASERMGAFVHLHSLFFVRIQQSTIR